MDWYILLIIITIFIITLIFLISFICFKLTFYLKNKKPSDPNSIILPEDIIFKKYNDVIIRDIKEVRGYSYKEYTITSFDGLKLYGKYYENIPGAPIEIMFHGYKGSGERDLSTGVKRAFKCGRNAFLIDQRGSGKSEGHITSFGINERLDCQAWAYYISKEFGSETKLFLTGISMGAATVLMASALELPENIVAILADCGYSKPSDIIKKVIKEMRLPTKVFYPFIKLGAKIFGKFDLEQTSPYECVQHSKLPIIFIHGDNDELVPCDMSIKLYEACTSIKKLVTIHNAEHGVSYLVDPEKYVYELNSFFNEFK